MSSAAVDQMVGFSWEKRPLKRPRLGPPDVYPQEAKQKEDELTLVNVKQGFSHISQISDEFGTAKNANISAAKLGAFINGTISKKIELNALPDTGKRRLQVNTKDHFWPVTPRHKTAVEAWMKDLAGNRPLASLAKRVPIFNKREEIFLTLTEHSVPKLRAAWFLKITASYNSAISEAKTKKRQLPDPSQEWTISLIRCLKDILYRLTDWYNGGTGSSPLPNSSSTPSSSTPGSVSGSSIAANIPLIDDGSAALRQWLYCTELAKQLFQEGLLDRFEWLQWVIEACERVKTLEDGAWKPLTPLLLSYIANIAQSELLARRMAQFSASQLATMFDDVDNFTPAVQPPAALLDHLHCPSHRSTVLALVSALQVVALECPTALVYNQGTFPNGGGNTSGAVLCGTGFPSLDVVKLTNSIVQLGSPLDLIPIPPSALPMPPRANNPIIRGQLRAAEEQIALRSRAVEAKWACDEWQQSTAGSTLQKTLSALDTLDRHCFDRAESSNSIESIYNKIFANSPISKENPGEGDAPIVLLLCQWAVGPQRYGEHRALAVALLLEHRQSEATSPIETDSQNQTGNENKSEPGDEVPSSAESGGNGNGVSFNSEINGGSNSGSGNGDDDNEYTGLPIYHSLLFNYLDQEAPTLDDSSPASRATFASLVHLFSALIRHDIFSHDAYLCSLVARGDLAAWPPSSTNAPQAQSVATPGPGSQPGPGTPASVSSVTPGATPHHDLMDDRGLPLFQPPPRIQDIQRSTDYDDRNIDEDLQDLLQHIHQKQHNMDQIDSPKDEGNGNVSGFSSMSSSIHQQSNSSSSSGIQGDSNGGRNSGQQSNSLANAELSKQSRHRLYVTHFPLPQDESCQHEANQRQVLLYGVGRARDEARHVAKKVSKDLGKLFSKKFCYDIGDGSRVKKHSKNEISIENLQNKFQGMTYYDQHAITSITAMTCVEMLVSFAAGRMNYLPTVEHISLLTELMESALNISSLVEYSVQMLRELWEVENQLAQRGSPITGTYTTSLQLQLVAILRRYHSILILDPELATLAWDSLHRLMKRLTAPTDCTSAERCTLAYLTVLQASCGFLRSKNLSETLPPVAVKVRQTLFTQLSESADTCFERNNTFMTQCLEHPRRKLETHLIKQLVDSAECRYNFVTNAVLSICSEVDTEKLNDLASLCAEMTAACPALCAEWLAVLRALCSPSRHSSYADILSAVDVKQLSNHSNLATLTALLVARQCFSLQDIVWQAVPCLLEAWNDGRGPGDTVAEAGARLTCHLFLSLFKTQDSKSSSPNVLKLSCDRRLLSAAHGGSSLGAVLAVLKAMVLLADAAGTNDRRREQRSIPGIPGSELSISHILGTSDVPSERNDALRAEARTLSSFALNALQQMCAEPWVRQCCLQNPDELYKQELLLDPVVPPKHTQKLLHMICYPDSSWTDESSDPRIYIPRIMESLDQWNLREAWLGLTLQHKQLAGSQTEHQAWLDIVARSALEVFHLGEELGQEYIIQHSATPSPAPGKSPRSGKKPQDQSVKTPPTTGNSQSSQHYRSSSGERREGRGLTATRAWLVAPLVSRLSSHVQGRVLRHAGTVLENTLWPKNPTMKEQGVGLHSHLPFLALILTCLRGQDEQRETLLTSLLTQFSQLLIFAKEADTDGKVNALRDALRLRLSLVGGMFDAVQRSSQATGEWAVILTQLVTHSVVDLNNNSDVFFTIVDMVTSLVHSTQMNEAGERVDKQNLNLIKKLKKELADRNSDSLKPLRQLLPFSKVQAEIIVTQPTSTIIDSKGNRVQSFEFVDKKPGLQVWEKQRVSPWELLEGLKNPTPLSWAWFGAVKKERRTLRYEEAHRLNKFHTHNLVKPFSHFLEPVPLPSEEIDVKPEIIVKDEIIIKNEIPCLLDQSPRGPAGKSAKPKPPRKKRLTKHQLMQQQQAQAQAQAASAQQQMNASLAQQQAIPNAPVGVPYGVPGPAQGQMPPGQQPPSYPPGPPWYDGSQQQMYYAPPQQQPPGPRISQSKAALHNMLRTRNPTAVPQPGPPNQFQQFPQGGAPGPGPRQQILRQQLRAQGPHGGAAMQGQGFTGGPPNQNVIFQQQQLQNQGMGSNYGYPNQPQMSSQGQGPVPGVPQGQGGMMNPQGQMMGPRGPVQELNFPGGGPQGVRPMGQRPNPPPFMQPSQPQPGMGGPMQPSYGRPAMGPMGSVQQPGQGMPNPNQMVQQGHLRGAGQMLQQGMQSGGQMGQMQNPAQMSQMQPGGQMGQMQNPGQMSQMQNPGQMSQMQPGQMGQMPNPGQMSQMQGQMQNPGQLGQMHNPGQMGQLQGSVQMGQPGIPNQTQMGQPGPPNMPNNQQSRLRQIMMQQQQQQQQNPMGMRGQGPMHYNPNQPGGY